MRLPSLHFPVRSNIAPCSFSSYRVKTKQAPKLKLNSYTPKLSRPFVSLASIVPNLPHLTPRVRELAILASASTYGAPFVLHAHSRIAQSVGLLPEQIADSRRGVMPAGLDTAEQSAWKFAIHLAGTRGPLDTAIWENARSCLGIEGVANLAHVVGAYAYMCLFQNAADTGVPGGEQL